MEPIRRITRHLHSYVDKDIQKMFLPIKIMQTICLNPKFCLKGNFLKPNNLTNHLLAVFGVLSFVSLLTYRMCDMFFDDNLRRYQTVTFLYFATLVDSFFYGCGHIMNFILHFVHTKNNVKIILIFQEIHRFVNDKTSSNMALFRNYVLVSMVFAFLIAASVYVYIVYMHPPWYVMCYVLTLISIDSNIVYAVCFMKLISDKIGLWNAKLMWSLEHGSHLMHCKKMARAYVQILRCFDIYKHVFELPETAETFLICLVKVQILIDFLHNFYSKNPEFQLPIVQLMLYAFMIKCLVTHIMICCYAAGFYDSLSKAQDLCVLVLASNCTDEEKKYCKNIQRLHRASFSKMNVCGLFYVDACQPILLMELITQYIIVLLQFAFL